MLTSEVQTVLKDKNLVSHKPWNCPEWVIAHFVQNSPLFMCDVFAYLFSTTLEISTLQTNLDKILAYIVHTEPIRF